MKLIRISAIWCPACLIMRPRLEKIKEAFPNLEQIEYDYDFDEDIVKEFNVTDKLPVFILFDEETEITRIIGEKTVDEIVTILEGSLK